MTREQLDRSGCDMPDCGHDHSVLHIRSRCHPKDGLRAEYEKATGECVLKCDRCRTQVVRLLIAREA